MDAALVQSLVWPSGMPKAQGKIQCILFFATPGCSFFQSIWVFFILSVMQAPTALMALMVLVSKHHGQLWPTMSDYGYLTKLVLLKKYHMICMVHKCSFWMQLQFKMQDFLSSANVRLVCFIANRQRHVWQLLNRLLGGRGHTKINWKAAISLGKHHNLVPRISLSLLPLAADYR